MRTRSHRLISIFLLQHAVILYAWFCLHNSSGQLHYTFSDIMNKVHYTYEFTKPTFEEFKNYYLFIFFQLILARFVSYGTYEHGRNAAIVRVNNEDKIIEYKYELTWKFPFRKIKGESIKSPTEEQLPYRCNGYACFYISIFLWYFLENLGMVSIRNLVDKHNYGKYIMVTIVTSNALSVICFFGGLIMRGYKEDSKRNSIRPTSSSFNTKSSPVKRSNAAGQNKVK